MTFTMCVQKKRASHSHSLQQMDTVNSFAVYGTLRDDDDSGATWTQPFLQQHVSAKSGRVVGMKMFQNAVDPWPYALLTQSPEDHVRVRIVSFDSDVFGAKLAFADEIEMYNADDPAGGMYNRKVVTVITDEGEDVEAIMYYVSNLQAHHTWRPITENDWLKRDRTSK